MTNVEKQHIKMLPKSLRPLSTIGYALYTILFALGPIGLIAVIVCAVSAKNVNVRRYARSIILLSIISAAIAVALFVLGVLNLDTIQKYAKELTPAGDDPQQVFAMLGALR